MRVSPKIVLYVCTGELRHISKLKPWPLYEVLTEKYEWEASKAKVYTVPLPAGYPASKCCHCTV
jgi:hypothetical protein